MADETRKKGAGEPAGTPAQSLEQHEQERRAGRLEPDAPGPASSLRYVGGGAKGGQNWANEGHGAGQSYSAGDGYAAAGSSQQPDPPASTSEPAEFAVAPEDLGIKDYDLQGGYGQPAADATPKPKRPKT